MPSLSWGAGCEALRERRVPPERISPGRCGRSCTRASSASRRSPNGTAELEMARETASGLIRGRPEPGCSCLRDLRELHLL